MSRIIIILCSLNYSSNSITHGFQTLTTHVSYFANYSVLYTSMYGLSSLLLILDSGRAVWPSVWPGVGRTSSLCLPNSTRSPGSSRTSAWAPLLRDIIDRQPGSNDFSFPLPVTWSACMCVFTDPTKNSLMYTQVHLIFHSDRGNQHANSIAIKTRVEKNRNEWFMILKKKKKTFL